jgi:hypothetical protein
MVLGRLRLRLRRSRKHSDADPGQGGQSFRVFHSVGVGFEGRFPFGPESENLSFRAEESEESEEFEELPAEAIRTEGGQDERGLCVSDRCNANGQSFGNRLTFGGGESYFADIDLTSKRFPVKEIEFFEMTDQTDHSNHPMFADHFLESISRVIELSLI